MLDSGNLDHYFLLDRSWFLHCIFFFYSAAPEICDLEVSESPFLRLLAGFRWLDITDITVKILSALFAAY
jgi:hypothetical protein